MKAKWMSLLSATALATALVSTLSPASVFANALENPVNGDGSDELIARGRYLVKITGCNDCHTPGYNENNGNVPESNWLIGTSVGYKGPWGTTYAANLRGLMANMSEKRWIAYAKRLRTAPPMPWFNLNAMTDEDLRAMYVFVRSLGDHPNEVPQQLPPGVTPTTPYINMEVVVPGATPAPASPLAPALAH